MQILTVGSALELFWSEAAPCSRKRDSLEGGRQLTYVWRARFRWSFSSTRGVSHYGCAHCQWIVSWLFNMGCSIDGNKFKLSPVGTSDAQDNISSSTLLKLNKHKWAWGDLQVMKKPTAIILQWSNFVSLLQITRLATRNWDPGIMSMVLMLATYRMVSTQGLIQPVHESLTCLCPLHVAILGILIVLEICFSYPNWCNNQTNWTSSLTMPKFPHELFIFSQMSPTSGTTLKAMEIAVKYFCHVQADITIQMQFCFLHHIGELATSKTPSLSSTCQNNQGGDGVIMSWRVHIHCPPLSLMVGSSPAVGMWYLLFLTSNYHVDVIEVREMEMDHVEEEHMSYVLLQRLEITKDADSPREHMFQMDVIGLKRSLSIQMLLNSNQLYLGFEGYFLGHDDDRHRSEYAIVAIGCCSTIVVQSVQIPWDPGGSAITWCYIIGLRTSRNLRGRECHALRVMPLFSLWVLLHKGLQFLGLAQILKYVSMPISYKSSTREGHRLIESSATFSPLLQFLISCYCISSPCFC